MLQEYISIIGEPTRRTLGIRRFNWRSLSILFSFVLPSWLPSSLARASITYESFPAPVGCLPDKGRGMMMDLDPRLLLVLRLLSASASSLFGHILGEVFEQILCNCKILLCLIGRYTYSSKWIFYWLACVSPKECVMWHELAIHRQRMNGFVIPIKQIDWQHRHRQTFGGKQTISQPHRSPIWQTVFAFHAFYLYFFLLFHHGPSSRRKDNHQQRSRIWWRTSSVGR